MLITTEQCFRCQRTFECNPEIVPRIHTPSGKKPVCRECTERYNNVRREIDVPLIEIKPGAYS